VRRKLFSTIFGVVVFTVLLVDCSLYAGSDMFFLLRLRAQRSTLFPYTTLFRSQNDGGENLGRRSRAHHRGRWTARADLCGPEAEDRKSTRLNSSHGSISYAVFCLKKKNPLFDRRTQ